MQRQLQVQPNMTFPNVIGQSLPNPNPVYTDNIIAPPQTNEVRGTIQRRLVIDSSRRNLMAHPTPQDYKINWTYEYKDVVDVELVRATIPVGDYVINETNNQLSFKETDDAPLTTITLAPGDYLGDDNQPSFVNVAAAIETAMNEASESDYTVSYNRDTGLFTISSDLSAGFMELNFICDPLNQTARTGMNAFQIERAYAEGPTYRENSIGQLIGFQPGVYNFGRGYVSLQAGNDVIMGHGTKFTEDYQVGDPIRFFGDPNLYTVAIINSDTMMTLDGPVSVDGQGVYYYYHTFTGAIRADFFYWRYIVLEIEELQRDESNVQSVINAFTVIPITERDFRRTLRIDLAHLPRDCETKFFNPPLGKFTEMRIRFRYPSGALYNFRGLNHMLEFKISALNQPGKYMSGNCAF